MIREINGDLIKLALEGKFDVIAHGCNCFCNMGAGIAVDMAKYFDAHLFSKEGPTYLGDINKLGTIDCNSVYIDTHHKGKHIDRVKKANQRTKIDKELIVVNAYTQFYYGKKIGSKPPLSYEALVLSMRKINHEFKGLHIGLPLIGCGLAGGSWKLVKPIFEEELKDMQVTIVHFKKI